MHTYCTRHCCQTINAPRWLACPWCRLGSPSASPPVLSGFGLRVYTPEIQTGAPPVGHSSSFHMLSMLCLDYSCVPVLVCVCSYLVCPGQLRKGLQAYQHKVPHKFSFHGRNCESCELSPVTTLQLSLLGTLQRFGDVGSQETVPADGKGADMQTYNHSCLRRFIISHMSS